MGEQIGTAKTYVLPYKFIYFDLDDTLLDHRSAEKAGLKDVYAHFSFFNDIDPDLLIDTYHKVNSEQWRQYSRGKVTRDQLQRNRFEQTLQQLDLDASKYEEVGQYYMNCYRNHWQWIGGAQKAYEQISRHYSVGILTNGFSETQQKKFEAFGLYNSADHTVISEEVGVLKPDPRVFQHATDLTGLSTSDIMYVGDSYNSDIVGGTRFGWHTAWFTQNGDAEKHQQANFVFSDFKDLVEILKV